MSLLLSPHHLLLTTTTTFHHHNHRLHHLHFHHHKPRLFAVTNAASNGPETAPRSAIQRIAEKLRSLGFSEENPTQKNTQLIKNDDNSSIGEIFIPNSRQILVHRVGSTLDPSWSTPQNPVPDPGTGSVIVRMNELRGVVRKERRELSERERERGERGEREKVPSLAELSLSHSELRRLTTIGIRMKQKMKLGKAGVTEGVVNGIHERWRSVEVVKIVCEDICRLNMKRTHDLLERKTGGMVVWRAGSKIILYRGVNYKYPYFSVDEVSAHSSSQDATNTDGVQGRGQNELSETHVVESAGQSSMRVLGQSLVPGVGSPSRVRFELPGERQLLEEADQLLDGLGPRFTGWWGCDPLPVDADLLPAIVHGYRRPFRLLPYGVNPKLTNDEMTILKRLGRPLPCHFALGRNRNHQGLASAILKLWEKCEIAKIAVKRGFQNTNSELMAEELKWLTGGILLSRDKDYIVFYRGKDFLPAAVSSVIQDRRRIRIQEDKQLGNVSPATTAENSEDNIEDRAFASARGTSMDQRVNTDSQDSKIRSIETAITRTDKKLSVALEEKARAEKLLSELEQAEVSQQEVDKEGITEEERYMLRRVGLKMKPFLLLGRRGVFDGTVENMHLHWKYRELVKIICGGRNIDEIRKAARTLEAESGGILVAVERVTKGHAIIVYRGKNYRRPASLRPQTLLNKKEALKRSVEAQRRKSLKLNVLKLTKNIEELQQKLVEDKEALDSSTDEKLKHQLGVEEPGLNSTTSDHIKDSQEGNVSPIQEENFVDTSLSLETSEAVNKFSNRSVCPETTSNAVQMEQMSIIADSSVSDDDPEASGSKIIHSAANGSSNASLNESLFHSTNNVSEPIVTSVLEDQLEHHIFENDMAKPAQESENKEFVPLSFDKATESNSHEVKARARPLSNKERLLLRKQALKMKRRPVLAVGRSNVISGVAKAIRDHFKKHPLAIVNVKGRAKGTSVQEVVFKLEQETGGVLVSQEPSKVILYRGWGAGVETDFVGNKGKQASGPSHAVSPELVAAMRLECGL